MAEVYEVGGSQAGARATLTRRSFADVLRKGFELLGGMERWELLEMLEAHKVRAELTDYVRERIPDQARIAGLRSLWEYLHDLPLDGEASLPADELLFQIGEVAECVGLSLRSVRYYDEAGLVHPSARTDGNFRLYAERDIARLETVKTMKPAGLSTEEMRELLALLDRSGEPDLLSPTEAVATAEELQQFADRSQDRIARLERDLAQARALRLRIGEHLARCR